MKLRIRKLNLVHILQSNWRTLIYDRISFGIASTTTPIFEPNWNKKVVCPAD